ncbi:hypothetical protein [Actinoplanes sp. NPDC026619]|uniref:hypothetical protein n=1 Tax=Actinoplanes sp. NPDC026619 TaxID=3155798 RepID=UPI0033F8011A
MVRRTVRRHLLVGLWPFLVLTLVQVGQLLLHRQVLPYAGTLAVAALLGHAASWGDRPWSPVPGPGAPQLAGLGGLAAIMAAAAVVDHGNGGYGWPAGFGPDAGAAAIMPAVLAAVLLPVAVAGAIQAGSRPRLRRAGIALLPAFAVSAGLLGTAAGVPWPGARPTVLVCVAVRTPCALPDGAEVVTAPARSEPEMDQVLRQFTAAGDPAGLVDDMRAFAGQAGGYRLRAAVVRFLGTPGGTRLTVSVAKTILRTMDTVCAERGTPTWSTWMSDPPFPLDPLDFGGTQRWFDAQDSAVFDLEVTSYLDVTGASRAGASAALEAALLLVGLGLVVRRVFPV